MTYLLDTNICIQYLNGRSETIRQRMESSRPQDIVMCSVVKAELFYGVVKSTRPEKNREKLDEFLSRFVSLPFEDNAAEVYGKIRKELEERGKPIGPNDLMIAAIAVANDLTLVTHNTAEFKRIKELQVEDWES